MKEYQTFIVRIWTDGNSDVARGHIQHVRTRRTLYFQDAARMLRFIDEHLAPLSLRGEPSETLSLVDGSGVTPNGADTASEVRDDSASARPWLSEGERWGTG